MATPNLTQTPSAAAATAAAPSTPESSKMASVSWKQRVEQWLGQHYEGYVNFVSTRGMKKVEDLKFKTGDGLLKRIGKVALAILAVTTLIWGALEKVGSAICNKCCSQKPTNTAPDPKTPSPGTNKT